MISHQNSKNCKVVFAERVRERLKQGTATTSQNCEGFTFLWPLGSPYQTYPFAIHDPTVEVKFRPKYNLLDIDPHASVIRIRSHNCHWTVSGGNAICSACQHVSTSCDAVLKSAEQKHPERRHSSYSQLHNKLKVSEKREKKDRLKNLNCSKALKRLRNHASTWKSIGQLVGTHDVPGLYRILKKAHLDGWSNEKLLKMLHKAVDGTYHPRNYSELDFDLAILLYELGGEPAVHAFHKSHFALPARTTLIERRQTYRLVISHGEIKMIDFMTNIQVMWERVEPSRPSHSLLSLSMDEVACDHHLCYLAETDEIGGLCEHALELESIRMGKDLSVLRAVLRAIKDRKVHIGQEVLVMAISRLDENDYSAKPIGLMVTCKRGTFQDAVLYIEKARQAWSLSPYGEALHGRLVSITSDGDPTRRPALHTLCMVRELKPADPLFKYLGELPGLNLWTGTGFETQDIDYKHTFKRICTLLCTREGLLVDGVVVNKGLISWWFEHWLTDVDWSEDPIYSLLSEDTFGFHSSRRKIDALLDPKDAQDVPRAIKLLSLISSLRNVDSSEFDPSQMKTHNALCLLGEMLEALIEPFTNPALSISEQIVSLVKFAHIACGLFISHESAFMPQHLYSDLQCMFRTAIFHVAHTKLLDPNRKVHLPLLGDDVLESLFGRARMIGGHCPNVDIVELSRRFKSALHLSDIFTRRHELERHPRRLAMTRTRDKDHLSPRNWIGELRAGTCDLQECWKTGVEEAICILRKAGYIADFVERFKCNSFDLMRPKGGVGYPGVSSEVDRSLGNARDTLLACSFDGEDIYQPLYNGKAAYKEELAAQRLRQSDVHSVWMKLKDDKPAAHKKTLLRHFSDDSADIEDSASHDRVLRVRYLSNPSNPLSGSLPIYTTSESKHPESFGLGTIYASLICVDGKVRFAVFQCTAIKSPTSSSRSGSNQDLTSEPARCHVDCAPVDEVTNENSQYEIAGQILSLRPILHYQDSSGSGCPEPTTCTTTPDTLIWAWDSRFVTLSSPSKATSSKLSSQSGVARLHHLNFTVPGCSTYVLAPPNICKVLTEDEILVPLSGFLPPKVDQTWVFSETVFCAAEKHLYNFVGKTEHGAVAQLKMPVLGASRSEWFPYEVILADNQVVQHSTTAISPPLDGAAPQLCRVCGEKVAGPNRQNHMGRHILRSQRGLSNPISVSAPPEFISEPVSSDFPCGFCGQSSLNGACKVSVVGGKVFSRCPQVYNFMVYAAAKSSKQKPCTNHPIKCICCPLDLWHWKTDIQRHLRERHANWETYDISKDVRIEFNKKIVFSSEELAIICGATGAGTSAGPKSLQSKSAQAVIAAAHPGGTSSGDARRLHPSQLLSTNDTHVESPRRSRHYHTTRTLTSEFVPFLPFTASSTWQFLDNRGSIPVQL